MKALFTIFLSAVLMTAMSSNLVLAQNPDRPLLREVVRKELERTDDLIDRAKEKMQKSNAPVATEALNSAVNIQKKAWEQFELDYLRIARQLTFEARELAKQALSRARVVENGEEQLSRKLDRAEDALQRLEQKRPPDDNSAFSSLLQFTKENLQRARELYNAQQYLPAYRLTEQVERAVWRLNRAANRDGRWFDQYENRAMQVSDLIDRTKDEVADCDVQAAKTLLEQAQDAFARAEKLADQDQLRPAIKALQQAQELANEAASKCEGPSSLETLYQRLLTRAEKLRDKQPQNDVVRNLLDQSLEQLAIARQQLDLNHLDQASAALRAAQLALRQAGEYLDANEH